MNRLYRDLKNAELVKAEVAELDPIPANGNPYHYDSFNMGCPLVRGWEIMHAGLDSPDNPRPLEYVVLINTRSGPRLRINLSPKAPTEKDIVYFSDTDTRTGDTTQLYVPTLSGDSINWVGVQVQNFPNVEAAEKGGWVFMDNHFVRLGLLKDRNAYYKALESEFFDEPQLATYNVRIRQVAALLLV